MDISSFAWPLSALGCVLAVAKMFKPQLASLLDRTTKVSKDGLLTGAPALQLADGTKTSVSQSLQQALDSSSEIMRQEQDSIKKVLADAGIVDQTEQITFLVHRLALSSIVLSFEEIRGLIFGSQLKVVTAANSNAAGFPMAVIREE